MAPKTKQKGHEIKLQVIKRIIYRIWQFKQTIFPIVDNQLWQNITDKFPVTWQTYFKKLRPSEKAHILRVYREAKQIKCLSEQEYEELIELAITHDIGKSITRHSILFKVAKVILPISNHAHCIEGAKLLKKLGGNRKLIKRVLRHHDKNTKDKILLILQEIDDRC